jgi:hypothetical protein
MKQVEKMEIHIHELNVKIEEFNKTFIDIKTRNADFYSVSKLKTICLHAF